MGRPRSSWGNPWFPHEPPPSSRCTARSESGLPAGKARLRPRLRRGWHDLWATRWRTSEPDAFFGRTNLVRHRAAFGLAALLGAAAVVLGGGGTGGTPPGAAMADPGQDLPRLVEEFAGGSSRAVVRRLEGAVADGPDARTLALLGLAYQQLARETGDASWLGRSGEALRRARSEAPTDQLTLAGSAQLAITRHRFREGARLAQRVLAQNRDDALALAALGDALVALGRHR